MRGQMVSMAKASHRSILGLSDIIIPYFVEPPRRRSFTCTIISQAELAAQPREGPAKPGLSSKARMLGSRPLAEWSSIRDRLRDLVLRDDGFQPRDVLQQTLTGENQKVIAAF